jgi:Rha family phage regulatory protein
METKALGVQMARLVFEENQKKWTTSVTVAEKFEKEHKNVTRDIEGLRCSPEFMSANFERISYLDQINREQKAYRMTHDTALVEAKVGRH